MSHWIKAERTDIRFDLEGHRACDLGNFIFLESSLESNLEEAYIIVTLREYLYRHGLVCMAVN